MISGSVSNGPACRWRVDRVVTSAEEAHCFWPATGDLLPLARLVDTVDSAVVFGSSTPAEEYSLAAITSAGYEVVRRRSGGGAVIVTPQDQLWLMLYLDSHDPLISSDLGRSFIWLGELFQRVIMDIAGLELELVTERQPPTDGSRIACFAGLGFGELHVSGRKVLGLSQRRSQGVVSFQASLLFVDRQAELINFLRPSMPAPESAGLAELCDFDRKLLVEAVISAITSR